MEKQTKNFLGKKRKNIFMIKKCEKSKNKNNHSKNSLIEISKLVLDYIKTKEKKTGNQITEYILKVLQPDNSDKLIKKNIQRRVYDAINVMNSLGLIKKNKQIINYVPFKNNNYKEDNLLINKSGKSINQVNKKNKNEDKLKTLEYIEKEKKLQLLQTILINKYLKLKYYEELSKLNNNDIEIEKNNVLHNKLLVTINNNQFQREDSKIFSPLINNSNYDVKKKIVNEILPKIDNNIYNKKNNNEKTITNIFKIKKNENNKEDKIGFSKKERNSKKNENVKEMNLNEDIVFNYLKNLKLFKNELFSLT